MDIQASLSDKTDIASLVKDSANLITKSRDNLC